MCSMFTTAAAHRTLGFFSALEVFIVQHRTCAIIACGYAAIIRMVLNDWHAPPTAPAWPIYNGAQLLDPSILEPLDRASVRAKAATVPSSNGRMRNERVRREAHTSATMPVQALRPLMQRQKRPPAHATEKVAAPALAAEEQEEGRCSEPGHLHPPRRVMTRARRVATAAPSTEEEDEPRRNNVDDRMILFSIGAAVIAYLVVRVAWVRGKRTKLGDTLEASESEALYL